MAAINKYNFIRWEAVPLTVEKPLPPTFNPASKTFYDARLYVQIGAPGCTIYYTTDNTAPNENSLSFINSGVVTVESSMKIRAIAVNPAGSSYEAVAVYSKRLANPLPTVSISPNPSTSPILYSNEKITITAKAGNQTPTTILTIRYTLDGSDPNTLSQIYTKPFLISSNTTVKAIVYESGNTTNTVASLIATASYNFIKDSIISGGNSGVSIIDILPSLNLRCLNGTNYSIYSNSFLKFNIPAGNADAFIISATPNNEKLKAGANYMLSFTLWESNVVPLAKISVKICGDSERYIALQLNNDNNFLTPQGIYGGAIEYKGTFIAGNDFDFKFEFNMAGNNVINLGQFNLTRL